MNIAKPKKAWTEDEVIALLQGVKKYGEGRWREIQKEFLPHRTNVMVKDKVRTMKNTKNLEEQMRIMKAIRAYLTKHPKL